MTQSDGVQKARDYYNSRGAEGFYSTFWGGEDIHLGIYTTESESIREASRRTVVRMADRLDLRPTTRVLDVGAGYGGSMRYLSKTFGCTTVCLNLSEVQNQRNRAMNEAQDLSSLVSVVDGNFEELPFDNASFDVVWSQDALLHSGRRERVVSEVARVLKPGGTFTFTDPMQADHADPALLEPVLQRIDLDSLASPGFYRRVAEEAGLSLLGFEDLSEQLPRHYARVLEVLEADEEEGRRLSGDEYVDSMKTGLRHWIAAGEAGSLVWGVFRFGRP